MRVDEHVFGLGREVEYHVRVHADEIWRGQLDALDDLVRAAVFVVTVHLLEQPVFESLRAHRETLHPSFQLLQNLGNQVVGVRLAGNLFDAEQVARLVDRLAQLVDHDRGRATADVDAIEVVAQIGEHPHLLAHALEIRDRTLLGEREAVERAVRAELLAERHVHVEHVALAGLRARYMRVVGFVDLQVVLRRRLDGKTQKSFGKHLAAPKDS